MSLIAATEERTAPSRVVRRTTPAAAPAALGNVYGALARGAGDVAHDQSETLAPARQAALRQSCR
jgi:hypothetical protein